MVIDAKTLESTINETNEKFVITDKPVMESVMEVLPILNKNGKIIINGNDNSCPATVSVANIITQNILKDRTKTEKISVDGEVLDDGRLISTIEIVITKINNQ